MERSLEYKVVELSTVDEIALERTVNQWVQRGWTLDGVQFAMRDSSKRPAMAFVFFTREGPALSVELEGGAAERAPAGEASRGAEPQELPGATGFTPTGEPPREPATGWARLVEMAGEDGGASGEPPSVGAPVGTRRGPSGLGSAAGTSRDPGDDD